MSACIKSSLMTIATDDVGTEIFTHILKDDAGLTSAYSDTGCEAIITDMLSFIKDPMKSKRITQWCQSKQPNQLSRWCYLQLSKHRCL